MILLKVFYKVLILRPVVTPTKLNENKAKLCLINRNWLLYLKEELGLLIQEAAVPVLIGGL